MSTPWLEGLNPPQREAVLHTRGPLLVLAGAGSGKTRVLTRRVAQLVHEGVPPWNILAVTFTNKAAGEMKERVVQLVGPHAERIFVSTFHSACARFLRTDIEPLGYTPSFTIYDADDQLRLVKQIVADEGIDKKTWAPAKLLGAIDRAKNRLQGPDELEASLRLGAGDPTAHVYRLYDASLRASNAVDFNDLINLVVRLWAERPDVLQRYQRRFPYLLVDEYQDTNHAQYRLVQLLARGSPEAQGSRNVMVVGDDDQSIYRFRGADVRNILGFRRDFPDTAEIRLEQNYRSTGHILAAAHAVVAQNENRMPKKLWTDQGLGEKVTLTPSEDSEDEARRVVATMRRLVTEGLAWRDMAVIYRTNAASRAFEQELVRARIPHVLVGARRFYERREVRDLLAYLRLVVNPTDTMAFLRVINVPSRGIGPRTVDAIGQEARELGVSLLEATRRWADGTGKVRQAARRFVDLVAHFVEQAMVVAPGRLVQLIAEETGYAQQLRAEGTEEARGRLENLDELASALDAEVEVWAEEGGDAADDPLVRLREFIDRASLAGQADELPDAGEDGRVTLLTAHLAKGLEFPVVFVTGMFEGGFPHFFSLESEDDVEEERRLVYVAFTRAMRRLYVSWPRERTQGGGPMFVQPSRFIDELPPESVSWVGRGGFRSASAQVDRAERLARLGLGADAPAARGAMRASSPPAQARDVGEPLRTLSPTDASAFRAGVRVLHPSFGLGWIRRTEGPPSNLRLHIQFDHHGRKVVFANYAKLELVQT